MEYLGTEVSQQIRFADGVELLWLESPLLGTPIKTTGARRAPDLAGPDTIVVDGTTWLIRKRANISDARGLVHARQSLIQDATYQWNEEQLGPDSSWTHALVYTSTENEPVTLLFDLGLHTEGYVREIGGTEKRQLTIPQGFRTFFAEQGNPKDWPY